MGISQEELQSFYQRIKSETGLPIQTIRRLLKDEFGKPNGGDLVKYEAYLKEKAMDINTQTALALWQAKLHNRIKEGPEELSRCPVCGSAKKYDRLYGWLCQSGGLRHFLAVGLAERIGKTPAEAAEILTVLADKKEQENSLLIAEWQDGLERHRVEWRSNVAEVYTKAVEET